MQHHRLGIWPLAAMLVCAGASFALARQGDGDDGGGSSRDVSGDDPLSLSDSASIDGAVVELADAKGFVDGDHSYTESLDVTIVNHAGAKVVDVSIQVHLNNTSASDKGWDPKHPDAFDHEMWIEETFASVAPDERRPYHISRSIRTDWKTFDVWLVGYRYAGEDAMEALKHFHRGHSAIEAALRTFGLSWRVSAEANAKALADVKAHAEDVRPTLLKWLDLDRGRDSAMGYLKHAFAVRALLALGDPADVPAIVEAAAGVDTGDFDAAIEHLVGPANDEKWSTLEPYPSAWLFGSFNADRTELDAPGYEAFLFHGLDGAGDAVVPGLVGALDGGSGGRGAAFAATLAHGLGYAGPSDMAAAMDDDAARALAKGKGGRFSTLVLLSLAVAKKKGAEAALADLRGEALAGLVDGLRHPDPAAADLAEKTLVKMGDAATDALLDARLAAGGAKLGAPSGEALVKDVRGRLEEWRDGEYRSALAEMREPGGGRKKDEARRALLRSGAALRALGLKMAPKAEASGDPDAKEIAAALVEGGVASVDGDAVGAGERMLRLAARVDPKSGALEKLRDTLLARASKLVDDAPGSPDAVRTLNEAIALIDRADPDLESDEAKDLKVHALVLAADRAGPSDGESLLNQALEIDPDNGEAKSALSKLKAGMVIAVVIGGGALTSPFWLILLVVLLRGSRWKRFLALSGGVAAVKVYKGPGFSRYASSEYGLFGQKLSAAATLRWDEVGYVYRRQQTGSPGQVSTWLDVIASARRVSIPTDPGRVRGVEELVDLVHQKCPQAVARSQGGGAAAFRPAVHGGARPAGAAAPSAMPVAGAPRPAAPAAPSGMPGTGAPATGAPLTGAPASPAAPSGMPVVGAPLAGPAGMPVAGAPLAGPAGMPVAGAPSGMPTPGAPRSGGGSGSSGPAPLA